MDLLLVSGLIGSLMYFKKEDMDTEEHTEEHIDIIKTVPDIIKTNPSIIIVDKDAEFNDQNRELKGLCTDIVVNDFFSTQDSLYNFLMLVYNMFEKNIQKYVKHNKLNKNDIFFTFKGGNILRIISKELILELPELAANKINNFYKDFFKRSDADFSIYINPKLEDYDKIYNDWCIISYYLQDKIRTIISNNLTDYFDYFKYNENYSQTLLKQNLDAFNRSNSVSDVENSSYYKTVFKDLIFENTSVNNLDYYTSLDDFITENSDDENGLIRSDIKSSGSFMYISLNKTLEFKSGDGGITKFALIRTKINFNLVAENNQSGEGQGKGHGKGQEKTLNMGGELIDVSIPHRKDVTINDVFNHLDKAISRYTITNKDKSLEFNSYSLLFLIEDLEKILFHVAEYPWDDNKYVKRLNRLCYLYFLDMFVREKNNMNRKSILQSINNKINIKEVVNTDGDKDKDTEKDKDKDKDNKPGENVVHLNRMLWYYNYIKNKMGENLDNKMGEFKTNITDNLKRLQEGFNDVETYCKNGPGNIDEEHIYTTSISNLV